MSHEKIARRLRDEGMASAPPDLAEQVMAAVRAEPRRTRRWAAPGWLRGPRLRPLVGWAAAAACLVVIGFGIAQLGGGGQTSAGSSGSAALSADAAGEAARGQPVITLTFASRLEASRIFGPALWKRAVPVRRNTYRLWVNGVEYRALRNRVPAGASFSSAAPTVEAPIRVILRVRENR